MSSQGMGFHILIKYINMEGGEWLMYNVEVRRDVLLKDNQFNVGNIQIITTPDINEDYWLFRISMHKDQYLNAFPKFGTIGIGFAVEEDWNTNLPYTCDTVQIADHIWDNRKYDEISKDALIANIAKLQSIIKKYVKEK